MLYVVVLTAVVISQSTCVGQILPGQIPRQIIPRQVITGQDQVQQQQDFFLIDESGTTVDGTGPGTGSILQLFPLALLTLAVTMMGMVTMSTVTSGTTVASTTTSVTVPTTQTAAQTTPCVPTNCPAGYRLLTDQAVSPNCYFFSGNNEATWSTAQKICSTQRGAYLWRPNSEEEAEAVRISIGIEQNRDIWVGANSPGHDGNYVFDGDNGDLSFCSLPFGEHNSFTKKGCVEIEFTNEYVWNWDDDACKSTHRYVCEFPRITCP
ncbi:unnamed protein product [Mytilus coruscus]|uniref:C-type lectin domain-containing protein n=1 Tax=Mytilus coruscus TaxID=42192 RepID=A0A6J8D792_MYTCO|nr:unnamed protein product [Mytilus coruscus]